MRILLVTDSYPPFIGGADRQIQMLGREMVRRGHMVSVATPWQPGLMEQQDDGGVSVHRLKVLATRIPGFAKDSKRRGHPPFPDPGITWGLRHLVEHFKPDIVHAYGWITFSCAAALYGKQVPLLVSARDYAYICAVRSLLHTRGQVCDGPAFLKCLECSIHHYINDDANTGAFGKSDAHINRINRVRGGIKGIIAFGGVYGSHGLLKRKVRGVHSASTFVQRMMRNHLIGEQVGNSLGQGSPIIDAVIPNFLAPSMDVIPEAAIMEQLPSTPYILFVGALLPIKGIWPLLAAYRQLIAPPPLVLIGPSFHNSPRDFPPGVTVIHNVPHATVMAAWERSLFGVVPSVCAETFGNVILEAMSKGKPVIGSAVGGITDVIIDGETGLLVPPGNVNGLSQAMQRLIDDAALCEQFGRAGQERTRLYTVDKVMPQFEKLYQHVINASRHKPDALVLHT